MSSNDPISPSQPHLLSLIQTLQHSNSELTLLSQKYRKQIQQKQKWSKSQISLLLQQNTRILSLNTKLEHSIHKLQHKLKEKEEMISQLSRKGAEIEYKLREVEEGYGGFWTEMSMLKNRNKELGGKVSKLKEEVKEKGIRVGYLEKELEYRRRENNSLVNRRGVSKEKERDRREGRMSSQRVNTSTNNASRSKSREIKVSQSKLRQEIECTISALDEMKYLSEHKEMQTKEQLMIKHQEFMILKQEFWKLRERYQQEIAEVRGENKHLKDQIGEMTERRRGGREKDDEEYRHLEIINNSLVFKLPYILEAKQEILASNSSKREEILTIISNLQLIFIQYQQLQQIKTLYIQQSQTDQQTHQRYNQQIYNLNKQIQDMNHQQQTQAEKLGAELGQLEDERLSMINMLHQKIREQEEIIGEYEEEKEGILGRVLTSNTCSDERLNSDSDREREMVMRMCETNEENQFLKLRNFEVMGLLEVLLHFLASVLIRIESKSKLDKYYRICQKYYWKSRQSSLQVGHTNSNPYPSAKSKLKKVLRCVLFACSIKVSKAKRANQQRPLLSNFKQLQQGNKRFLNLFSQLGQLDTRQENKVLQKYRKNGSEDVNMYQQMIGMINCQMNNKRMREREMDVGWVLFEQSVNREPRVGMGKSRSVGMFKKRGMCD